MKSVLKSLHLIHCNSVTQGENYVLLEIKQNLMNDLSGVLECHIYVYLYIYEFSEKCNSKIMKLRNTISVYF